MSIVDQVRAAGVVGAGGAGFPTHVKLNGKAEVVIANGAECEPLLRVDQLLMARRAGRLVRGIEIAMESTGAKRGVIATKAHYYDAVEALQKALSGRTDITLHLMDSYYPSGDEKSTIFEVTGRVVPSGKLPLDVGCVVSNIGTLLGVADAAEGKPVIKKVVTVGGDVPNPVTVEVPIGVSLRELLPPTGFEVNRANELSHALLVGGPLMGKLEADWDAPVTKTTGGLLVFPKTHSLILKRMQSPERQLTLARAVCCQCSLCTQLCPRNALGLRVEPHKAMRAFTTGQGKLLGGTPLSVLACSSCGLCTHYACNFGLAPSEVMAMLKAEFGKAGIRPQPEPSIVPDAFVAYKRVPVKRLMARMGLNAFDRPAPWMEEQAGGLPWRPSQVRLLTAQHLGQPSRPVVQKGALVEAGELIAEIPEGALSAALHASISGKVSAVTPSYIEISA